MRKNIRGRLAKRKKCCCTCIVEYCCYQISDVSFTESIRINSIFRRIQITKISYYYNIFVNITRYGIMRAYPTYTSDTQY